VITRCQRNFPSRPYCASPSFFSSPLYIYQDISSGNARRTAFSAAHPTVPKATLLLSDADERIIWMTDGPSPPRRSVSFLASFPLFPYLNDILGLLQDTPNLRFRNTPSFFTTRSEPCSPPRTRNACHVFFFFLQGDPNRSRQIVVHLLGKRPFFFLKSHSDESEDGSGSSFFFFFFLFFKNSSASVESLLRQESFPSALVWVSRFFPLPFFFLSGGSEPDEGSNVHFTTPLPIFQFFPFLPFGGGGASGPSLFFFFPPLDAPRMEDESRVDRKRPFPYLGG